MTELRNLITQRGNIKGSLTRFKNYIQKENPDLIQVKERLNKIEPIFDEFNDIQLKIENLQPDNEANHIHERETFEDDYFIAISHAKKLIFTLQPDTDFDNVSIQPSIKSSKHSVSPPNQLSKACRHSGDNPNHSGANLNQSGAHSNNHSNHSSANSNFSDDNMSHLVNESRRTHVKLPPIKLPTFSGKHEDWLPFKELFEALVDNDKDLREVHKLYYLRSSLSGPAADVIQSLELTGSNYKVAWELITQNFENKYLIAQKHVEALFNVSKLEKESAKGLRELVNNIIKHVRAIHALGFETNQWDLLLIHLVITKLDSKTCREWMSSAKAFKEVKFENLREFLMKQCNMLEAVSVKEPIKPFAKQSHSFKHHRNQYGVHFSVSKINCKICSGDHKIFNCDKFLKLSIKERQDKAKELNLCYNCLRSGHSIKTCLLKSKCLKCRRSHNTLLHLESENSSPTVNQENNTEPETIVSHSMVPKPATQVLLSTALVNIQDDHGNSITCRALLDCGSQSNFMRESICQKLNLKKYSTNITLTGVNDKHSKVKNSCTAYVQSPKTNHRFLLEFLIINKITNFVPCETINYQEWNIPTNIELADPEFYKPGQIDILLGAEVFWNILCVGQLKPSIDRPILQKTTFGWIVGGSFGTAPSPNQRVCNLCTSYESLEQSVSKFWQIESCPDTLSYSKEDKECEILFKETTSMTPDGRFIVSLPLKGDLENLKGSKEAAIKRFYMLEKRLMKDKSLRMIYIEFMQEYSRLNHMELVTSDNNQNSTYYIPHHPVIREESLTTKLRVVFDASCSSSSKTSLNDLMMNGPVVQDQLCSIIIRFQKHKYVMCADVEKMYRQILIKDEQRDLQRIVWREDPSQPLNEYRLCTVTYGTRSAPYLATRTLIEIANLHEQEYPEAAKTIKKDFYVDDLMTGNDSVEKAVLLQKQIRDILGKHGFILRKWCSNNQDIISNISSSEARTQTIHEIQTKDTIKTLGLQWHNQEDTFSFSVNIKSGCNVSKRVILSQIAQVFDPLGLVGPVIVLAKILLQEIWQLKLGWDETQPLQICTKWINYLNVLPCLNNLKIKRILSGLYNVIRREIQGFVDASQSAIYFRCQDSSGNIIVQLVCAITYGDKAKTFVSSKLQLNELRNLFIKENFWKINNYLINDTDTAINWHIIPPRSPHIGGMWEAGVKYIKFHLRTILGDVNLNNEEMLF